MQYEELSADEALVNRCECINKTFEQLKVHGSFEEARKKSGAGVEWSKRHTWDNTAAEMETIILGEIGQALGADR